MDVFGSNPFTVFTLVTAPAMLTNASAVMSLTTSNRLARAVDHSRTLLAEIGSPIALPPSDHARVLHQLETTRQRALLMVRALAAFQLAFGCFAATTVIALLGAALGFVQPAILGQAALFVALIGFLAAVTSLVVGAWVLVHETRLAYTILRSDTIRLIESLGRPVSSEGSSPPANR